ncbi:MAG: family 1 glycosylhydrolase [Janthinobacterium lividum]
MTTDDTRGRMELWGGLECTINRVQDTYFSQLDRNGHATRDGDIERFASLNIQSLRYPVLWERIAPRGLEQADWTWPDCRLPALRDAGIEIIAGLLHHGSGPAPQGLLAPDFPVSLANFAGAVAQRYPWISRYTPVNEPNTTARFSGLYGVWHPHARDDRTYLKLLFSQCRATVLSMEAIRRINPHAALVQTDDLGKTYSHGSMAELAEFYNRRRWLSWDLLCGKVVPGHELWDYILEAGIARDEVQWFADHPCPPDIVGINYYVTSERWLDDRPISFPHAALGEWRGKSFIDIEAVRVAGTPPLGVGPLLDEAWERYGLPLAITEAHIDAFREDQIRWLGELWTDAEAARLRGVDVRALTVWALLGSFDWNCLVVEDRGYYESGAFDVRAATPRPTAVAHLMRELGAGRSGNQPAAHGTGWWRREDRYVFAAAALDDAGNPFPPSGYVGASRHHAPPTILIVGKSHALGQGFARLCGERHLACRLLDVGEEAIHDPDCLARLLDFHKAWALINTADYPGTGITERDRNACLRGNVALPASLARACQKRNVRYLGFSTDLLFDGKHGALPYVESDAIRPLTFLSQSKVHAEQEILATYPGALVVRTGPLFSPWTPTDFLSSALDALSQGRRFVAHDQVFAPTYMPDLIHACLDLMIDGEAGLLHLTNHTPVTCFDWVDQSARRAEIDAALLRRRPDPELGGSVRHPIYSALRSERVHVMPLLDDALNRYIRSLAPRSLEICE